MIQVILAVLIIVLGVFCFKVFPMEKRNTRKLALSALMIVITLVFKRLAIMVPLFGAESLKIGFEYIPLMLAGYILSPSYAFVIGISSDLLGLIITPTGFPFFGFTLSTTLVCVLPSLIKNYSVHIDEKKLTYMVIGLIVILGMSGSIFIGQLNEISISSVIHAITSEEKMIIISICIVVCAIFIGMILILKKRFNDEQLHMFSTWLLCVVAVEVIVTFIMTPTWLSIMYGIPYFISLCIRIIKACIIIPIEVMAGYYILKATKKALRI